MPKKPQKLILPKDPVIVGHDTEGKPIWLDPKDLVPSGDEIEELKANRFSAQEEKVLTQMVEAVFQQAAQFAEDTFLAIAPKPVCEAYLDSKLESVAAWHNENGFNVIQDGIETIIKYRGKVIRSMRARIDKRYESEIARRVRKTVKEAQKPVIQT